MTDAETRLALRRGFYRRLRWLWPLLDSSLLRPTLGVAWRILFGGWLVFALLILGLRFVVLPNIGSYHAQIEQAVTAAIGQPVSIGSIEARWQGLNPDLILENVVVADRQGNPAFTLQQVEAVLSWTSIARRQVTLALLAFERPVLHVRREVNGRITVAGIDAEGESDPDFAEWVLDQAHIRIRNATVLWEDRLRQAPPLVLEDLQFGLDNKGRSHRFGLSAAPPAELAARIDVRGEINGDLGEALDHLSGRIFLELDYADLAGWRAWVDYPVYLPQGRGALRLWGDLADSQGKLTADLALEDVRVRLGRKVPELALDNLRGRLVGRYKENDWAVAGSKVELLAADGTRVAPTDFQAEWKQEGEAGRVSGSAVASFLDFAVLGKLAAYLPLDPRSRELLERHRPQGRISELRAAWTRQGDDLQRYSLKANFADLGLLAGGYFPGAKGLSGLVELTEAGGSVSLDSQKAGVSLPAVFSEPDIAVDLLRARASWKVAGEVVDVKLERLQFEGADATGTASGRYRHSGDGPGTIDLAATVARANGAAVWRYLPKSIGQDVRDWVRRGIVSGKASDGKLILKGNLADFPFRDGNKGAFLVTARATDVTLDYASDWPRIEGIDADLSFGVGMRIVAERGNLLGARLSGVTAEIPDLESLDEMLNIRGEAQGPTGEFLRFIEQSPVSAKIDHFTQGMKAEGTGRLELAFDLPLRRPQDTRLRGDYRFQNNQLELLAALPPLTQVNGTLAISDSAVSAQEITGRAFGGPLKVGIRSLPDRIAVRAAGTANVADLGRHFAVPGRERLEGSAAWKSDIAIRRRNADFVVESDLVGISSSLPEPLGKAAATPVALRVERVAPDAAQEQFSVTLGKVLRASFLSRGDRLERAAIVLGEGSPTLPDKGVSVRIALPRVDADAWRALADSGRAAPATASSSAPATLPVDLVAIQTPLLHLFGRDFQQVDTLLRRRDDGWQIALNTQEAVGDIYWRGAGAGWLEGRLKRLRIRPAKEAAGQEVDLIKSLPGLSLVVDDFMVGDTALGQLELKAQNDKGSWQLDTLSLKNPDGALNGKAVWVTEGRQQTRLNFDLTSGNVGKLLDRLGYADTVKRGSAKLGGDLKWDGPLTDIHFPTLTGQMTLEVEKGQFNKVDPGVGKLLGLLSLQSLPRRLTLDFGDIFSEGLAFDKIEGKMTVKAGVMRTAEPLRISSPAAQIDIKGETDLKNETQSLDVAVRPYVGGVAAAAGAATLVNPLLGAAALVAGAILQNPIGRLFSYSYHVTGTWTDPKFEKVGQTVVPAATVPVEGGG